MISLSFTRRTTLFGLAATLGMALRPGSGFAGTTTIRVAKDPNCGCCGAWIEILEADGFAAVVEEMDPPALQAHKGASGIPAEMASCHTAHVEGYAIEGHVPAVDIRRLLAERPAAVGLAVPGMPYGSPGMGPEAEREAFAVYLIRRDGTTEVFTAYEAA